MTPLDFGHVHRPMAALHTSSIANQPDNTLGYTIHHKNAPDPAPQAESGPQPASNFRLEERAQGGGVRLELFVGPVRNVAVRERKGPAGAGIVRIAHDDVGVKVRQ